MTGEFEIRPSNANCSRSLTLQVVVDDVHVVNAEEFRGSEGGGKGDYCALFKLVASGALELPVLDIGSWGWWTRRGLIKIVRSPLAKRRGRDELVPPLKRVANRGLIRRTRIFQRVI